MVHDAGFEEEQLVEWGLARLAQNPPERISVGLRAKQEKPLDQCRAERGLNDPLSPPPEAGRSVPVQ